MDTERRIPKEPREESQLLQVIGKSIGHHNAWRLETGERVAHFKVILATCDLPGVSPGRSIVNDIWMVYPPDRLVTNDRRVVRGVGEESAVIEVKRRVALEGCRSGWIGRVITSSTTVIEIIRIADRHSGVVDHEHGKCDRVNSLQLSHHRRCRPAGDETEFDPVVCSKVSWRQRARRSFISWCE
jgi:hypothetical protein